MRHDRAFLKTNKSVLMDACVSPRANVHDRFRAALGVEWGGVYPDGCVHALPGAPPVAAASGPSVSVPFQGVSCGALVGRGDVVRRRAGGRSAVSVCAASG